MPHARPLRVAHLISGLQVGGAETMLARLVTALDPERVETVVISISEPGPIGDTLEAAGVQVVALGLRQGIPDLRTPFRVAGLLRRWRADVLQTWLYHADVVGGMAGWVARVPVVWNVRQTDLSPRTTRLMTRLAAQAASQWSSWLPRAIVCVSHATREAHSAIGYDRGRMEVIPNGFDLDLCKPDAAARSDVRRELGLPSDAPLVGMLARFDPAKDHQTMLHAAARLPRNAHVVLAGTGVTAENRALTDTISELGLAGRVHLIGPRSDVPRLAAAFDVCVSSSISEGFSNAIGEAMACGVPCVVTDVGDSALIVGETGRVVPPSDPAALAGAITELLLLPPDVRQRLGRRARERIDDRYGLQVTAGRYVALWRRVARLVRHA